MGGKKGRGPLLQGTCYIYEMVCLFFLLLYMQMCVLQMFLAFYNMTLIQKLSNWAKTAHALRLSYNLSSAVTQLFFLGMYERGRLTRQLQAGVSRAGAGWRRRIQPVGRVGLEIGSGAVQDGQTQPQPLGVGLSPEIHGRQR